MTYQGAKDGKHYWLTPKDVYAKLDIPSWKSCICCSVCGEWMELLNKPW